jgi:hypothetical protein
LTYWRSRARATNPPAAAPTQPLTAEARFENYASTYRGDRRALSSNTRRYLGTRPGGFPSNKALILNAADVLKPQLQERLAYSSRVI